MLGQFVVAAAVLAMLAAFAAWIWVDMKTVAHVEQEMAAPPNWNEQLYLAENPDIAAAVRRGRFKSGWHHYVIHGIQEGRKGVTIEELPADRK